MMVGQATGTGVEVETFVETTGLHGASHQFLSGLIEMIALDLEAQMQGFTAAAPWPRRGSARESKVSGFVEAGTGLAPQYG